MQIEKLNKALAIFTKEEWELMETIFYREERLRSIGKKSKLSINHQKEGQIFRKTKRDIER